MWFPLPRWHLHAMVAELGIPLMAHGSRFFPQLEMCWGLGEPHMLLAKNRVLGVCVELGTPKMAVTSQF